MRTRLLSILVLLIACLLWACGANAPATEEVDLSNVYTAAASTLAAQKNAATETGTPTPVATMTAYSSPTYSLTSPTAQNTIAGSYSSATTANGCNNSIYVSDVTIADGSVLAPGESFTKTWEFQNTGTCSWNEDYLLTFVSGNAMDGETTAIDQDVPVGYTGDISVILIAPSTEGTYTGYWRLADENGNAFGQSVYVMIVVSDDAATTTPTSTSTTESTESEATSTSEPTATAAPTATFTATPIPTETAMKTDSE